MDIQKVWHQATGLSSALPMAGFGVSGQFHRQNREVVEGVQAALVRSLRSIHANPAAAASSGAKLLRMPSSIILSSLPYSNLVVVRASAAKAPIKAVFNAVLDLDPAILGGKLPDNGFYL
jgi:NitT/TauT family transport system substrate-binding protein